VPEPIPVWHYDGRTALRQAVTIATDGADLLIVETGERVPIADLLPMGQRGGPPVFGRKGVDGWRIGLTDPVPADWAASLPGQERHGGLLDRIGVVPALLVGAALAALFVFALSRGTSLIARLVPERWELAFGDAMAGDLGGRVCTAPAGQAALDRLTGRLSAGGGPARVRVVDMNIVNAVTLPGRQIVLFRGLIAAAQSPDEIAGVLGHELGHVDNRDVMTGLLRDFGISLLIGGADGGQIAQTLLSSRYGRAAERAADAHAITALTRADISPADTAAFFDRLGKSEPTSRAGRLIGYVSTHPLSAERRQAFVAATRARPPYRPAMSAADWQALRTICGPPVPKRGTTGAKPR
jgi:Zn-dependent protease with chaperone function